MKKKNFIILLIITMFCFSEVRGNENETSATINMTKAGSLSALIKGTPNERITSLTITGPINGDDIIYLRTMNGKLSKLDALDLTECNIVSGGAAYYVIPGNPLSGRQGTNYYTAEKYRYVSGEGAFREPHTVYTPNLDQAFSEMPLKSMKFPKSISKLGIGVLSLCREITFVEIPNNIKVIGVQAFYGCSGLKSISLQKGISTIENGAFQSSGLTSIDIPEGVDSICNDTFNECRELTTVKLPSSLKLIGSGAFSGTPLSSIEIPNGITLLSDNVFGGCPKLTSVTLPINLTHMGSGTFSGCTALQSITFPSSLTHIGNGTFNGCTALQSITFPNSLTNIGEYAFANCTTLKSIVLPNSVTTIGASAFHSSGLTSVTLSDNLQSIGIGAFLNTPWYSSINKENGIFYLGKVAYEYNGTEEQIIIKEGTLGIGSKCFAEHLEILKVTFPESLRDIGSEAFYNCDGLATVKIPNSVNTIGSKAFADCKGLYKVIFNAEKCEFVGVDKYGNNPFYKTPLTDVIIGDKVTLIPDYFVSGQKEVTSVSIPNSVTEIGEKAFYETGLTSVSLPNSVTYIGGSAFPLKIERVDINDIGAWCSITFDGVYASPLSTNGTGPKKLYLNGNLVTNITIPDGITKICDYAFSNCGTLETINIPKSVTSIGNYAFYNAGLNSVTGGENITSIGGHAFAYSELTSVAIPEGVTKISDYAFSNCETLETINIPKSVTSIGNYAFYNAGLNSVIGGENITSIGEYAFADSELTSVAIPKGVTEIGESAFSGTELTSVAIPEGVTSIEEGTFYMCKKLTSVSIPDGITEIGRRVFGYCRELSSIIIPDGVTTISSDILDECNKLKTLVLGKGLMRISKEYEFYSFPGSITELRSRNPIPPVCEDGALSSISPSICTLYVPIGSKEAYATADEWKDFFNVKEFDPSGVNEVVNDDNIKITTINGELIINGADENAIFEVYNINGQQIYKGNKNVISIAKVGVYIVRVAGQAFKILMK